MAAERIDLVHELVSSAAAAVPERVALLSTDGAAVTFGELDRQVATVSAWVTARTRRHDRIAVIADNGIGYAVLYYAVPRSRRTLTLINQRLSPVEQMAQLASAEPTVLLGDAHYLAALPDVARQIPSIRHVMDMSDSQWPERQRDSAADVEKAEPDDPAWLLFTSGSTGTPKGVLHSHRSLTAAVRGTVVGRAVEPGGVYLLPFPMCHVAGYNLLVHHLARSTVLLVPAFRPRAFVELVVAHGVTSCSLAPTMLHGLLTHLDETGTELPTLRSIAYGSAAISADLLRRALARLDVDFHQGYGMTETGGNITFLGPAEHRAGLGDDPSILATAGRPHPEVEVRIASDGGWDGDGRADGVGEILVCGEQVSASRWPDGAPLTSDGWLPTGDVGRIDDEGRLVVVDRVKDVIITGGENVSSREIEDVLSRHPAVDQVAVVGVPDDYWGEAICAVVVAAPGKHPAAEDLVGHVRSHLSAFKRPRHVLFADSLPLTSNGKVAKDAVRRSARERVNSGRR